MRLLVGKVRVIAEHKLEMEKFSASHQRRHLGWELYESGFLGYLRK